MIRLWLYLTDAKWRRQRGLPHPIAVTWRLLWVLPMLAAFLVFLLFLGVMHGPSAAVAMWEDAF